MASAWAIEATYEDVVAMINQSVTHCFNKYGGEFDEWLSHGNYLFMEAYYEWNESRGASFSTYLKYILDRRMVDFARRHAKKLLLHERALKELYPKKDGHLAEKMPFIEALRRDLSEDAQSVVALVLDTPVDIKLMLHDDWGRMPLKRKMKMCLREFLEDFGWDQERVGNTFKEIQEAL